MAFLKAMAAPFPEVSFCPTGGVKDKNFEKYLALPNVPCVGSSWLCAAALVQRGDWTTIAKRTAIMTAEPTDDDD